MVSSGAALWGATWADGSAVESLGALDVDCGLKKQVSTLKHGDRTIIPKGHHFKPTYEGSEPKRKT